MVGRPGARDNEGWSCRDRVRLLAKVLTNRRSAYSSTLSAYRTPPHAAKAILRAHELHKTKRRSEFCEPWKGISQLSPARIPPPIRIHESTQGTHTPLATHCVNMQEL